MDSVKLKAPAKINLTLNLVSKRHDGYHNISSVMQTIALFDNIIIRKSKLPGIKVFSNIPYLPTDKNNLVYKIAQDLMNEYKIDCGITIKIFKRIPIGAGLGGGSSDCATTLKAIIKLFQLSISKYQTYKICERYGADVPFCFMGGTVLTSGIGNILKKLPEHPKTIVLLVKPKFSVSTARIYKLTDKKEIQLRTSASQKIIHAIKNCDIKMIAENFYNALESSTADLYPDIYKIKNIMLKNNALGSCMSGSGPTVFGYFENFYTAKKAAAQIEKKFPQATTFLTQTFNG